MKMFFALFVLIVMFMAVVGLSIKKLGWVTPKQPDLIPYEILEVKPKPEVKIDLVPEIKKEDPEPDPVVPKPIEKQVKKEQPKPKPKGPTNIVPPLPKAKPEAESETVEDWSEWKRDKGWR